MPETNRIKEIASGVYWVLLSSPKSLMLRDVLDPQTQFVLCWDHEVGDYTWSEFDLPVLDPRTPIGVISRIVRFDFVIPTRRFLDILPGMKPAIKAVQLSRIPPDHLDMNRIHGKHLHRILRDCGWHVLLDTPANDYGQMMSPKREVLERAIEIMRTVRD